AGLNSKNGGIYLNILTALNAETPYSQRKLQLIFGAWVASGLFDRSATISADDGDVSEDDYAKQSIYALLYSVYREIGTVTDEHGAPYEFTFNTWGYDWPERWGAPPHSEREPQRFGQNAYTGLFEFQAVKEYAAAREGKLHIVELGCGTGAGAHHICGQVWPDCTYIAIDMQGAAIQTCERRHVPELGGRLTAVHGDVTKVHIEPASADFVVICETHVAEYDGQVTDEDRAFFQKVFDTLKPGGFLVWGNAIPARTWQPCFDYLETVGMRQVEVHDVTEEAVRARQLDEARVDVYVEQCLARFHGFKIPVLGKKRRRQAELALKNFYRHPGTRLYEKMTDGTDSYRVALFQKPA
ncbi:MAG: SAM-dependent methyltransferase, partial [Myxococcota bacterium]